MEKISSLSPVNIKTALSALFMAALLFAPNIASQAYAMSNDKASERADYTISSYLETDSSLILGDSVTFREISLSENGQTEIITTYEETIIYQDNITRKIPNAEQSTSAPDSNDTPYPKPSKALATYGSFHVITPERAEMFGTTDSYSLDRFNQMMAAYPSLSQIDMVDVSGTVDDEVNLALANKIHALNITTHIPQNGSVRSGGVELFLAGKKRTAHPTANFAVHSWRDEDGYEPHDYADDDPIHQDYIEYYQKIAGMSAQKARDFYWMTNSAPHDSLINLTVDDIGKYANIG